MYEKKFYDQTNSGITLGLKFVTFSEPKASSAKAQIVESKRCLPKEVPHTSEHASKKPTIQQRALSARSWLDR